MSAEIEDITLYSLLNSVYSQPQRYYHNMQHLNYLHAKLHEWSRAEVTRRHNADKPFDGIDAIVTNTTIAIWWHDFEYNIFLPPGLNEKRSAMSYLHFTNDKSGTDSPIYNAIIATANHLEDQEISDDDDGMVIKLMLDCDLAGFAMPMEAVRQSSLNVLKEYEPLGLGRRTLLENRIKFLDKLLKRNRIFYTDYFFDTYEATARKNIEESIEDTKQELAVYE